MAADRPRTFFSAYLNPTDEQRAQLGIPPKQLASEQAQQVSDIELVKQALEQIGFVISGAERKKIYKFVPTSQFSNLKAGIYYYPDLVDGLHLLTSLQASHLPALREFMLKENSSIKPEALVFNAACKYTQSMPQSKRETDVYLFTHLITNGGVCYLPDSKLAYNLEEGHVVNILGDDPRFRFSGVHNSAVTIDQLLTS